MPSQPRSRLAIPLWAIVCVIVAGLAWQMWRGRESPPAASPVPHTQSAEQASAADRSTSPAEEAAGDRRDLSLDERRGGHTLARHVGRTDEQLRERLQRERNISTASTYPDRATAERVVGLTLKQSARRVDAWVARDGSRPNLALDYRGSAGAPIGRSLRRGRPRSVTCTDALVVLRWDERNDDYYVLTSYPEERR